MIKILGMVGNWMQQNFFMPSCTVFTVIAAWDGGKVVQRINIGNVEGI